MKEGYLHITEKYSIKNGNNLRARKLLAGFLELEAADCKIPLRQCSQVLLKFVKNYNDLVSSKKEKSQQSLFS